MKYLFLTKKQMIATSKWRAGAGSSWSLVEIHNNRSIWTILPHVNTNTRLVSYTDVSHKIILWKCYRRIIYIWKEQQSFHSEQHFIFLQLNSLNIIVEHPFLENIFFSDFFFFAMHTCYFKSKMQSFKYKRVKD